MEAIDRDTIHVVQPEPPAPTRDRVPAVKIVQHPAFRGHEGARHQTDLVWLHPVRVVDLNHLRVA